MKFLNKNPNDIIITEFGSNTLVDGFNVINIIYAIIIYLFKIDINQIQLFFSLFNISLFIFLLSLIAQVTFFKINQGGKFWIKIVLAVLFLTISNIASWWLNQYAWVILSTILLVSLHMAKQNEISSKILIYAINFCVLFGVAFDILFIISATVVNILQLFLSYKSRKENATEYNIMMCFSNLLVGANVFDNTNYASFILILIIISSYVLYLFYKSSNIAKKVNNKLDEFFYKWINLIIIICIIIVVLVSIGLFFSNENKKIYLDPWLIVNLESNNQLWFYLINIWFWIFNILFFVYSLFKNSIFRFKFLNRFFDYPEVDGAILGVFSFWNPIVLNIFKVLADQNILSISVDLKVIFFAVFTPLLLAINKKMSLSNKISISNYILISGVVASSALIIASINMGVVV